MYQKLLDFLEHRSGDIIATILIFIIGYVLARILLSISQKAIAKSKLDPICHKFFLSLLKVTLYSVVVILGCSRFVDTSSLVALLSVVGVAVSLAVKDSLSNVAGGFIVLFSKPFKVGDFVELDGMSGSVQNISILQTKLLTFDNKAILIPNGQVSNAIIVNYAAEEKRLLAVPVPVGYDTNIQEAKSLLLDLLKNDPLAIQDPSPVVVVTEYADSAIQLSMRTWVHTNDYWTLNYRLLEQVKDCLDRHGIVIPYNQLDVNIVESKPKNANYKVHSAVYENKNNQTISN